jgi:transcriptional regulator with XRE-family HTH domain
MVIGSLLRHWRERRRLSQAELAELAEVSARHLSCLERGRARPSRPMVLVLASALDVPLRERNTLLRAAGFAPAYRETDLGAPEMAQVRLALELMLHNHEPHGAVVLDRTWNVLMANRPWRTIFESMMGPRAEPVNLLKLTFDPGGLKPLLLNWEEVAKATLERVRREAATEGDDELHALYEELCAMPGVPDSVLRSDWSSPPPLVIPVKIGLPGVQLSLFTTLTTLGTPTDVTLSELRIEAYHPADEATAAWMRAVFGTSPGS